MEQEDIVDMLQGLGCRKIKVLRGNVLATCPFERNHANGQDNHPGFTIEITPPGEKSRWNCFACGERGLSMGSFAYKVKEILGVDLTVPHSEANKEYKPQLALSADWSPKKDRWWKTSKPLSLKIEDFGYHYRTFPRYAIERGLDEPQVKLWRLGWDDHRRRLFIPTFDVDGALAGWTTRASRKEDRPKYFHCPGFTKENYLYGEHLWDPSLEVLCLSEGFFDVWQMHKAGLPNPSAFFGQGVGSQQVYKIVKRFKKVVIFPHNDKPGKVKREGREFSEKAGFRMAEEWKSALEAVGIEVILAPVIRGKKDVGEWDIQEILYVWREKLKLGSLCNDRL